MAPTLKSMEPDFECARIPQVQPLQVAFVGTLPRHILGHDSVENLGLPLASANATRKIFENNQPFITDSSHCL
jgi:hypothetical protein